jgi:hypothetical protein
MAKIKEEIIVVKLSRLVRDSGGGDTSLTSDDFASNLETIVQELVGENTIVEVEKA